MQPISVLLVDDHRDFLRVLARYLQVASEGQAVVVGVVSDGHEAVAKALTAQPEVILLDLKMPDPSGVVLLPQLRKALPHAIIVVLTMAEEAYARQAALADGADGFVTKSKIAGGLWPTIQELVSAKRIRA